MIVSAALQKVEGQEHLNFTYILAVFLRLRQAAIAPFLICSNFSNKNNENDKNENQMYLSRKGQNLVLQGHIPTDIIEKQNGNDNKNSLQLPPNAGAWLRQRNGTAGIASTKIRRTMEIIAATQPQAKVIIFSSFTKALHLIQHALRSGKAPFSWVQIDGSVDEQNREDFLEKFKHDPKCKVVLINYKCGCEGLNLTEATHIIFVEPWWTPAVEKQAIARAHRIGQTQEVHIWSLYNKDSIEDKVQEKCKEKNRLSDAVLGNDTNDKNDTSSIFSKDSMYSILRELNPNK